MASILYAKACDPRVSAGDHADVALPLHMDIHQLHASFRPERWLTRGSNLDQAVRLGCSLPFLCPSRPCLCQCNNCYPVISVSRVLVKAPSVAASLCVLCGDACCACRRWDVSMGLLHMQSL